MKEAFGFNLKSDDPLYQKLKAEMQKSGKNKQTFLIDHFRQHLLGSGEVGLEQSARRGLAASPSAPIISPSTPVPHSNEQTTSPPEEGHLVINCLKGEVRYDPNPLPSPNFVPRCNHCQYDKSCMHDQHGEEGRLFTQCQTFKDVNSRKEQARTNFPPCNYLERLDANTIACHLGKMNKYGHYEIDPHISTKITNIPFCWKCYDLHTAQYIDKEETKQRDKWKIPKPIEPVKNKLCRKSETVIALDTARVQMCKATCNEFDFCMRVEGERPPNIQPSDQPLATTKEELKEKLSRQDWRVK